MADAISCTAGAHPGAASGDTGKSRTICGAGASALHKLPTETLTLPFRMHTHTLHTNDPLCDSSLACIDPDIPDIWPCIADPIASEYWGCGMMTNLLLHSAGRPVQRPRYHQRQGRERMEADCICTCFFCRPPPKYIWTEACLLSVNQLLQESRRRSLWANPLWMVKVRKGTWVGPPQRRLMPPCNFSPRPGAG